MGSAEESLEIKQRWAVYERPSCKESVFGRMLVIKTIAPSAHYLQHYYCSYEMYQYAVKHASHFI